MGVDASPCVVCIYLWMQGAMMVKATAKGPGSLKGSLERATWEDLGDRGRPPGRGAGLAVRNWCVNCEWLEMGLLGPPCLCLGPQFLSTQNSQVEAPSKSGLNYSNDSGLCHLM